MPRKKNTGVKTAVALALLAIFIMPKATTAAPSGGNGSQSPGSIPTGGVLPGAAEGSLNESFLGTNTARGIRNNNPGNIKWTSARLNDPWQGSILWADNTDGTFEQFEAFPWGVRAMIKLLSNYIIVNNRDTIKKIIASWDLGNPAYTAFLVQRTGLNENQVLTADRPTLKALAQAIARYETGEEILTDPRFDAGYNLFLA